MDHRSHLHTISSHDFSNMVEKSDRRYLKSLIIENDAASRVLTKSERDFISMSALEMLYNPDMGKLKEDDLVIIRDLICQLFSDERPETFFRKSQRVPMKMELNISDSTDEMDSEEEEPASKRIKMTRRHASGSLFEASLKLQTQMKAAGILKEKEKSPGGPSNREKIEEDLLKILNLEHDLDIQEVVDAWIATWIKRRVFLERLSSVDYLNLFECTKKGDLVGNLMILDGLLETYSEEKLTAQQRTGYAIDDEPEKYSSIVDDLSKKILSVALSKTRQSKDLVDVLEFLPSFGEEKDLEVIHAIGFACLTYMISPGKKTLTSVNTTTNPTQKQAGKWFFTFYKDEKTATDELGDILKQTKKRPPIVYGFFDDNNEVEYIVDIAEWIFKFSVLEKALYCAWSCSRGLLLPYHPQAAHLWTFFHREIFELQFDYDNAFEAVKTFTHNLKRMKLPSLNEIYKPSKKKKISTNAVVILKS